MLAADLYGLGFRGERGGLETTFGAILGESFDPAALSEGLGVRYEIMRGYFKPYSGCRYTHAAVDAILKMQAGGAVDPGEIVSVEVATYDIAATLTEKTPQTPLAARFSLPHVVAATLILGSNGPEAFTPQALNDPRLHALAARVTVVEDPEFTAMTPARRPARVTLHLADGTQRQMTVTGSKGDPDQPMTSEELEAKFHNLVEPTLGAKRSARAWELLGSLEHLTDFNELQKTISSDPFPGSSPKTVS
jgi:2-methylcitrate dehydratase PrpD